MTTFASYASELLGAVSQVSVRDVVGFVVFGSIIAAMGTPLWVKLAEDLPEPNSPQRAGKISASRSGPTSDIGFY
jgi:hypothetical protein